MVAVLAGCASGNGMQPSRIALDPGALDSGKEIAEFQHSARPDVALDKTPAFADQLRRPDIRSPADPAPVSNVTAMLLGYRPDVAARREAVEAAANEIGVAKAAFYPDVDLIAFAGMQSLGIGYLLRASSTAANMGPAVTLPIFEGGRLRASLKGKVAEYDAAASDYNATIAVALQQVADGIATVKAARVRQQQAKAAERHRTHVVDLQRARQRSGPSDAGDLLAAETASLMSDTGAVNLRERFRMRLYGGVEGRAGRPDRVAGMPGLLGRHGALVADALSRAQVRRRPVEFGLCGIQCDARIARIQFDQRDDHPEVRVALERVRAAALALERTTIRSPISGMVAQRTVQLGKRVGMGDKLMAVVSLDQLWVDANFKEVQLAGVYSGQPAVVKADIYGSRVTYHGTVDDIEAGSGSAFALLPPRNATGNWIKVVQRVPVRIRLNPDEVAKHPLRIGMSTEVDVDTSMCVSGKALKRAATVGRTALHADQQKRADEQVAAAIGERRGEQP